MAINVDVQSAFLLQMYKQLEGTYIPASGVYAERLLVQKNWYDGVCNVGYKPTFTDPNDKQLSIEVHILNFEKNIYGEEVHVAWYKRIRSERKFDGIEALKMQIEKDKQEARQFFHVMNSTSCCPQHHMA
ncbi:Riboflavin biosynthesis protein OS=Lysinibacillus sphaericus OX=1421 GN=ribF PE=3 SV=1 [Lysinibacillus sphaericus]